MKDASFVTFASSTPRCSTTIFFTFSAVSLIAAISPAAVLPCLGARGHGALAPGGAA
jgi:hypothetical protein